MTLTPPTADAIVAEIDQRIRRMAGSRAVEAYGRRDELRELRIWILKNST